MVRAGRGGMYIDDFEKGYVAIGWSALGDLKAYADPASLRQRYIELYGNDKPARTGNAIGMLVKFRDHIKTGDYLLSYRSETREYLVGKDLGEYHYESGIVGSYANVREVDWLGKVSRDQLSKRAKNTLGSVLTLFALPQYIIDECLAVIHGQAEARPEVIDVDPHTGVHTEEVVELKDETIAQSHEQIKDKIAALTWQEMEKLVASILRAMGYQARVSPKGPDRGVDVLASPDGLGLTLPRIKAEVKHRKGSIGSQSIRSFISVLCEGDSALYVSTGGFTKEARSEAECTTFPVTLVDLDDVADLIVTYYDKFDLEGRALITLVRIYWPAD